MEEGIKISVCMQKNTIVTGYKSVFAYMYTNYKYPCMVIQCKCSCGWRRIDSFFEIGLVIKF